MTTPSIAVPLRLRPRATALTPTAWFIPGADAAAWFAELAHWEGPLDVWRAAILPRSRRDPAPSGLLLVPGAADAADRAGGAPTPRGATPWVVRAGRLAHPADAEIWPPLADGELAALFPHDLTVLHPGSGALGFAAGDLLAPADLLAAPPRRARRWTATTAPAPAHLRSVTPLPDALSALMVLEDGRDGIGTARPEDASPDGQEQSAAQRAASTLGAHLAGLAARLALGLGALVPSGSAGPTWIDRLLERARQRLAQSQEQLDRLRHQELLRLLRLLDQDQDEGLRYALPIDGEADHRGRAQPGARLGQRRVDFDARRLGGGRAADHWGMPEQLRQGLRQRYLAAAAREIGLGRHRRAAYIHAHLLNDFAGAARALETGGHWREAAALWRERLKQPREEARCLESGELWPEAAAAWGALKVPERQAHCLERHGDRAGARAVWQAAVAALLAQGDVLGAAQLTEARLADADGALALLAGAWPDHPQAGRALPARVALLGRLGRHEHAQRLWSGLAGSTPAALLGPLLEAARTCVATYPERAVRQQAADAGRCALGLHLAADGATSSALVQGLVGLDPADRLLARDVARWQVRKVAPRSGDAAARSFSLGGGAGVHWFAAQVSGSALVALGKYGGWLRLARLDLESGTTQHMTWDEKLPDGRLSFFLSESSHELTAFLQVAGGAEDQHGVIPILRLPTSDQFRLALRAGTLGPIMRPMSLACAAPSGSGWWGLAHDAASGRVSARFVPRHDHAMPKREFPPFWAELVDDAQCLTTVGTRLCLANGQHLRLLDDPHARLELPSAIHSALPHPDASLHCVIASLAAGAAACWYVSGTWRRVLVAERLRRPLLAFTRSGVLIACDGEQARAYRVTVGAITACGAWRLEPACSGPVAMTCGLSGSDVAVLQKDGTVRLERVRLDPG